MHKIGFDAETFAKAGNALALSEYCIKYIRPLRNGDRFHSRAWVLKVNVTSLHMYQELVKVVEAGSDHTEEVHSCSNFPHRHNLLWKPPSAICT